MTKVFIANANKQFYDFGYRIPGRKLPVVQRIPPFGQTVLKPSFDPDQLDRLIETFEAYAFVDIRRLEQADHMSFGGMIVAFDEPVPEDTILAAIKMREAVLNSAGAELRKIAAIEMINTIKKGSKLPPHEYEISVAEIEPDKGFERPEELHIAEGWKMTDRGERRSLWGRLTGAPAQ
jgi:hypothetical protein